MIIIRVPNNFILILMVEKKNPANGKILHDFDASTIIIIYVRNQRIIDYGKSST